MPPTVLSGIPELVEHDRTGLMSPPGVPAELAENIAKLLNDPAQAERLGRCARERVIPQFSAEHMVEQIDVLYRQLLESPADAAKFTEDPNAASPEETRVVREAENQTAVEIY